MPAIWFTLANLKNLIRSKRIIALILPLLFALPLLLKNQIQVNNPLAPLKVNNEETRYIGNHEDKIRQFEILKRRDREIRNPEEEELYEHLLQGYWPQSTKLNGLIYYSCFLLLFAGLLFRKQLVKTNYWSLLFMLVVTLSFWMARVGVYWWNSRFIWPLWLCLVLLYGIWLQIIFKRLNIKLQSWFIRASVLGLIGLASLFYWKNTDNFNRTFQGVIKNEYKWRKQFGRSQDAMTLKVIDKLKKEKPKNHKIISMVNPTYGLVPWSLLKSFETEEVVMNRQKINSIPRDFEGLIMSTQEKASQLNLNPLAQCDTIYEYKGIIVLELSLSVNEYKYYRADMEE